MRSATVSLALSLGLLTACGADSARQVVDAVDDGDDDDDAAAALITGLVAGDDGDLGPAADPACAGRTLFSVGGRIVDDGGAGIAGARVQMCTHSMDGTFACLRPTAADDDGVVRVEFPERTRCLERIVARVLVDEQHATLTCGVSLAGADTTLSFADPVVVPRTHRGTRADPGVADVALAGALSVTVDDDVAPGLDLSALGAVLHTSSCVAAAAPPRTQRLWALSPEGGLLSPGLPARVLDTGLAPGTRVSAHVLGGLDCRLADSTDVERGTFAPFASALRVDDDGGVSLGALPCLTWLALTVD